MSEYFKLKFFILFGVTVILHIFTQFPTFDVIIVVPVETVVMIRFKTVAIDFLLMYHLAF